MFHIIAYQLKRLSEVGLGFFSGASVNWIEDQKVPYAVKGNEWVGYDTKENYDIKDKTFGGAFVWTLDLDDFSGEFCGQGKHAPMWHLNQLLGIMHAPPPPTTTPKHGASTNTTTSTIPKPGASTNTNTNTIPKPGARTNTTTSTIPKPGASTNTTTNTIPKPGASTNTTTSTTPKPGASTNTTTSTTPKPGATTKPTTATTTTTTTHKPSTGFCNGKSDGFYPDPTNPSYFYHCHQGETYQKFCASGTVYDDNCKCCNWP